MTSNLCYQDFCRGHEQAEDRVKLGQHIENFVGSMSRDVHTGGKCHVGTTQQNHGDIRLRFGTRNCARQLLHHRNIDHIDRLMG